MEDENLWIDEKMVEASNRNLGNSLQEVTLLQKKNKMVMGEVRMIMMMMILMKILILMMMIDRQPRAAHHGRGRCCREAHLRGPPELGRVRGQPEGPEEQVGRPQGK